MTLRDSLINDIEFWRTREIEGKQMMLTSRKYRKERERQLKKLEAESQ